MTAGSDGPASARSGSLSSGPDSNETKLHLLLPASRGNVNLCKTLLTLTILGYPAPHIIGWGAQDGREGFRSGGSHLVKITAGLDYVNDAERRKQPGFDDELIFIIDSYDMWFQLPAEVLIARYRAVVALEDAVVARRMGRAFGREGIRSKVVFGAGKRCAPNQLHTVACYAVPESSLPKDLRRGNTDTVLGRNMYSNFRTRYLNSGYIIGPVGAVRPMLERAKERLDQCARRTGAWFDNGSGLSDECYHGSDQSIFADIFGEQEMNREMMRRRHRTLVDDWLDLVVPNRPGARPPASHVLNTPVQDSLKPAFTHQAYRASQAPSRETPEFGIGLDYWSLLGHQTANAEFDSRYIRHDDALGPQVGRQGIFDCLAKAPMPRDLPAEAAVLGLTDMRWGTMPLYTEICLGSVPVMIHHNSVDKTWREKQWNQTWLHGHSRRLLEERRRAGAPQLVEGIPTDKGTKLPWSALCPRDVEGELFRDKGRVP